MPKLEEGTYLKVDGFSDHFKWWRIAESSNEWGWYARAYCLGVDSHVTVERNNKKEIWKIHGLIAEPFTEFEYLLLRATDTQTQGTRT